jgi:hypothetical protein
MSQRQSTHVAFVRGANAIEVILLRRLSSSSLTGMAQYAA